MPTKQKLPKIITILGPTASGKSNLAVDLAIWLGSKATSKKLGISGAEIISADSRQAYKGMDIGTGKITKKEMKGIPHHLLDVADPKKRFDIARYKKLSEKSITKILAQNKIPIICGGTGFYIQAIIDNIILPDVKPNKILRKKLEKNSLEELLTILEKLDSARIKSIDKKNKRRIIRAIEIAITLGNVPKIKSFPKYQSLQIGISKDKDELRESINKRLLKRLKMGMINEVEKLHASGVSWKKLHEFGLEYKYISLFLQNKISGQEMVKLLNIAINQYAKRQMTWFKRDNRIIWLPEGNNSAKNKKDTKNLIIKFLET